MGLNEFYVREPIEPPKGNDEPQTSLKEIQIDVHLPSDDDEDQLTEAIQKWFPNAKVVIQVEDDSHREYDSEGSIDGILPF